MSEEISAETVAIVYDRINDKILLGMKKQGFGKGKWNGLGGKYDSLQDRNLKETCQRELREETSGFEGIIPVEMGVISFRFPENPNEKIHEVHFFRIDTFMGEIRETNEMLPKWFSIKEIPYNQMWIDDSYWLPLLLKGRKFIGEIDFAASGEILRNTLKVVESL